MFREANFHTICSREEGKGWCVASELEEGDVLRTNECDIPWSSGEVSHAASEISHGAKSVTVSKRSQAEELFLGLFQGKGYKNTKGRIVMFLSPKQINELKVGTALAVELLETEKGKRRFMHVNSYFKDKEGRHRSINYSRRDDDFTINYNIIIYSVPSEVIENDWDAGGCIIYHYTASDIQNISELEDELKVFLSDFSLLKPSWYCDDVL